MQHQCIGPSEKAGQDPATNHRTQGINWAGVAAESCVYLQIFHTSLLGLPGVLCHVSSY